MLSASSAADWEDLCRLAMVELRSVEWRGPGKRCMSCGAERPEHDEDCSLAAVLAVGLEDRGTVRHSKEHRYSIASDGRRPITLNNEQVRIMRAISVLIDRRGYAGKTDDIFSEAGLPDIPERRRDFCRLRAKKFIRGYDQTADIAITNAGHKALEQIRGYHGS